MIVFENPGLIAVEAITTMGVSVKDEGAIGYFGTGIKFAIATVLRNGGQVTIWRGTEKLEFSKRETMIRDKAFELVTLNGKPLGFTTQLGRNWEPWMAFREFATNCKDEGGTFSRAGPDTIAYEARDGHTGVIVTGLDSVWEERGSILLQTEPLAENEVMEVHPGVSRYVFYRGVRIFQPQLPTAFTYNLLQTMELTEDRTAKAWYLVEIQLERGIARLEDREILRRILTAGEFFAEHFMDVHAYGSPQESFLEMARELTLGGAAVKTLNPKAAARTREEAAKSMEPGASIKLAPSQQLMLDRAMRLLTEHGFPVSEFPISICETLGPGIHGLALDGKIYISVLPFHKGTREVAATLLEEYSHLKSGHGDKTRSLQDWLFDQVLMQIETAAGEPF